jgi:6-phosphogluconate dehydrogenase
MQVGMIGLGRMGGNMVQRWIRGGHACVVTDRSTAAIAPLVTAGATGAHTLPEFTAQLSAPRVVWLMVPAAAVDATLAELMPKLSPGDIVVDGGNSYFVDDIDRAERLRSVGIRYVDVGTSGGVFGLERGYCLMVGGAADAVARLAPLLKTLAPGVASASRTTTRQAGNASTAEEGYLHCGPCGAGHFVKMVHNGIEYGLMAAYAEGFNLLHHANAGSRTRASDAENAPLRRPDHYRYEFNVADIAELWRRGSVVSSWLLDLAAGAMAKEPHLAAFTGRVSDSGEGRWTLQAAIDSGTPVPVLSAALYQRFTSRGEDDFATRVLSAMRLAFGGHLEQGAGASAKS